jgi:transcriptional regulator with XRE-family HTH domain
MTRPRAATRDQELARRVVREQLAARGLTLRNLARRCGLRNHMMLSRFLAGKQALSIATLSRVLAEVNVTGSMLERILRRELPAAMRPLVGSAAEPKATKPPSLPLRPSRRLRQTHPLMPFVCEALRLLGRATAEELRRAFRPELGFGAPAILASLSGLRGLGMVEQVGDAFRLTAADEHVDHSGKDGDRAAAEQGKAFQGQVHLRHMLAGDPATFTGTTLFSLPADTEDEAKALLRHVYRKVFEELARLQAPGNKSLYSCVLHVIPVVDGGAR